MINTNEPSSADEMTSLLGKYGCLKTNIANDNSKYHTITPDQHE